MTTEDQALPETFDALVILENDPGPMDLALLRDTTEADVEALVATLRSSYPNIRSMRGAVVSEGAEDDPE